MQISNWQTISCVSMYKSPAQHKCFNKSTTADNPSCSILKILQNKPLCIVPLTALQCEQISLFTTMLLFKHIYNKPLTSDNSMARSTSSSQTVDQNSMPCKAISSVSLSIASIVICTQTNIRKIKATAQIIMHCHLQIPSPCPPKQTNYSFLPRGTFTSSADSREPRHNICSPEKCAMGRFAPNYTGQHSLSKNKTKTNEHDPNQTHKL